MCRWLYLSTCQHRTVCSVRWLFLSSYEFLLITIISTSRISVFPPTSSLPLSKSLLPTRRSSSRKHSPWGSACFMSLELGQLLLSLPAKQHRIPSPNFSLWYISQPYRHTLFSTLRTYIHTIFPNYDMYQLCQASLSGASSILS